MKHELTLQCTRPEYAETLTHIAITAKRHWGYPETWIQLWVSQLTITPEYISQNETWLAAVNDEPVAFYSLKQDDGIFWLDHLWVLPEFIGQGLGATLFRHALMRARLCGAPVLRIESDPNAQGFYEKMGAVKVGESQSEVDGQVRILPVMEIRI